LSHIAFLLLKLAVGFRMSDSWLQQKQGSCMTAGFTKSHLQACSFAQNKDHAIVTYHIRHIGFSEFSEVLVSEAPMLAAKQAADSEAVVEGMQTQSCTLT